MSTGEAVYTFAKSRNQDFPRQWLVTDFTVDQIERRVDSVNAALKRIAKKNAELEAKLATLRTQAEQLGPVVEALECAVVMIDKGHLGATEGEAMSEKPMTKLDVMFEHFRTETMLEPEELEVMADEAEAELAELRTQAKQLGPVVEALENAVRHIGELSDNVRHEEFCDECNKSLTAARAAMDPETHDESE